MIEALRKHDPKEVQRILATLTSELLPNPGIYVKSEIAVDPELHSQLWSEIRRRVKVDPSDSSAGGRGKLFEFLFSEMSRIALPRSELESVKAKLSFRGELRSDLYDVQFHPGFNISEVHGVRRNHVLEAIRNANDVEHLNLLDDELLVSLFVRIHNDLPNEDRFALLVLANRIGPYLEVSVGLRIYLSDVDLSSAQRPMDVLRCLVEKYGFVLTVGQVTGKLIVNKTTTIEGSLDPKKFIKVHALEGAKILGEVSFRRRKLLNSYGVAIAYALDQGKYAAELRKHGVQVQDHDRDFRTPFLISGPE